MNLKEKLRLAELRLSLPALAQLLGYIIAERPGQKCSSPFRQDNNPSWAWFYAPDGRARWKDWTTGDGGDCAAFLARALGVSNREAVIRYLELAGVSDTDSGPLPALKPIEPKPILPAKAEPKEKPKLPEDLHKGTEDELLELLGLRDWDVPVEHLDEVSSLGFLRFGTWQGKRAWFLVDPAGRFFEARRMDGQKWPHGGKSDGKGSRSLLGAELVKPGSVALLLEGAPDFVACSIYKSLSRKEGTCFANDALPVAFFGSSLRFSPEELERFKGVRVIVLPHLDPAGRNARDIWKAQLRKAGAYVGDVCLQRFVSPGGKDLSDTFFPYFNEGLPWAIEARAEQLRSESK